MSFLIKYSDNLFDDLSGELIDNKIFINNSLFFGVINSSYFLTDRCYFSQIMMEEKI